MNMCRDYSFEPETSDYSEDYWLTEHPEVSEEDFDLLHLTDVLNTLEKVNKNLGISTEKATAAIEAVLNKINNIKE